jgi:hypothetical protein
MDVRFNTKPIKLGSTEALRSQNHLAIPAPAVREVKLRGQLHGQWQR